MRTADRASATLKAAMNRIDINGTATWLWSLKVDCLFLFPPSCQIGRQVLFYYYVAMSWLPSWLIIGEIG
jgi:hypothetical protein